MTLDQALEWIGDDELVEVTPNRYGYARHPQPGGPQKGRQGLAGCTGDRFGCPAPIPAGGGPYQRGSIGSFSRHFSA